jgi:hypothetical protein
MMQDSDAKPYQPNNFMNFQEKVMPHAPIQWLLSSSEPWTRYRTCKDLLDGDEQAPELQAARVDMLAHPQVQALIAEAAAWPGYALRRHNDAGHPLYRFSTLADFGLLASDLGMTAAIQAVMAHQAPQGAFQSLVSIPKAFGGSDEDGWTWLLCDAPTLLYSLLSMGLAGNERVQLAIDHLAGLVEDNGWRCVCAPELGKFRGPGKKNDPCPIANVYALKALSLVDERRAGPAARAGAEALLSHWENRGQVKMYMFGIGSDFRKLKYPFVWYDILHVLDVLSRFPFVHNDPRFQEMLEALVSQADPQGRYTPGSMYRAWKDWSFADKKNPSPWLTFLVLRILKRVGQYQSRSLGNL